MAVDLYELLVVLSTAILVLSFVRCFINHDSNPGLKTVKRGVDLDIPSDSPLRIDVYYEALDADSEIFITQQLIPTYHKIKDATDIILVPYVKTQMFQNSNGTYEIQCEHGTTPCEANMLHACILDSVLDVHFKLLLIGCLLSYRNGTAPSKAFLKCSQEHQLPQSELIEMCVNSGHGMKLLQCNGIQKLAFSERPFQIPFIILNESVELEAIHTRNLYDEICKHVRTNVKLIEICDQQN